MKIEPISVHGSYEYMDAFGMKRWKKISIGATVTEEDNPIDCILELEKKVEEAYKKISKELEIVAGNTPIPIVQIDKPKMSPEEELIQAINGCTSLDGENGLLSYRIPASLSQSTKSAYDLKALLLKK